METRTFKVDAGWHERRWCPVAVDLGDSVDAGARWAVTDLEDGVTLPAQVIQHGTEGPRLYWIIPWMAVGQTRRYKLVSGGETEGVKIDGSGDGTLSVSIGGSLFTKYNYGSSVARPYLYPVYVEQGIGVTRNWPMVEGIEGETSDHPHHKGIYTAQGEVNGVDNWGEESGHGYQIHKEFTGIASGGVAGGFVENLDWTDADRRPNMSETRSILFYSTPTGKRIFDYTVSLHAAYGDVTLGDTKEGGLLSVRMATSMDAGNEDGGIITNSFGGTQETETWGKRATWCDYSGPVGDKWYGICMMDHQGNPRHPTPWHVRNYGLMTANCFGFHHFTGDPDNRHDMVIPDGESRTWKYRVLIHSGTADQAGPGDHYHDFINPPTIEE